MRDETPIEDGRAALHAAIEAHRRAPLARVLARRGLGPYRGYSEVLEALDRLAARGARVIPTGRSVRGETIFAVEIGEARARPRTAVVLAGVHANEWIGVEVALAVLDRLAGVDLAGRSLLAIPVVNPDGFIRVEMNLRTGRHRFVRRNARGVDLNRNFETISRRRSLAQRFLPFAFHGGSHAASEPEVQAVAHALAPRRVDRAVSLHSFGGVVLYPPASSVWPVADWEEHRTWARRIARAADPRPYRAFPAWSLLGLGQSGLELDWLHERHGAVSLLVECSRGGFGLRPSRLVEPFAWYNPARIDPVTIPLAEALSPFLRGLRP